MTSFDDLKRSFPFYPIRDCPGRYVLRGGTSAPLEALVRSAPLASVHVLDPARDRVSVVPVEGGGLISYEKPDGTMVHTLGDALGFARRLAAFGIDIAPAYARTWNR